jgi:hypothetical protein
VWRLSNFCVIVMPLCRGPPPLEEDEPSPPEQEMEAVSHSMSKFVRRVLKNSMGAMQTVYNMVTPILFYAACTSGKAYDVFRLALSYHDPPPFTITVPRADEGNIKVICEAQPDYKCCVRLKLSPESLQWQKSAKVFHMATAGRRQIRLLSEAEYAAAIMEWVDKLKWTLDSIVGPESNDLPEFIGFQLSTNITTWGNSFVAVYRSQEVAERGECPVQNMQSPLLRLPSSGSQMIHMLVCCSGEGAQVASRQGIPVLQPARAV